MYQAMPARLEPPTVTAVSSAPHTLPFAYITCCMRVSLESGRETTSSWAGWAAKRRRQQPTPAMVGVVVSSMQWPWGTSVLGAKPEPGCCCFGGTPYVPTLMTLLESDSAGDAEFSEDVLVNDQSTILFELRVPAVPATGFCASSAAF